MSISLRRPLAAFAVIATLLSLFVLTPPVMAGPPGDNGPIVYVALGENSSGGDLYTVQANGTGADLVLAGLFTAPDVSPDGTQVLATELPSSQAFEGAIVTINLDTGAKTTVVASGASSAAWSGDGSAIAYAADGLWVKEGSAAAVKVSDDINAVWDWSPVDDRVLVTRNVPAAVGLPSVSLETVDALSGAAVVINDNEGGLFTWYPAGADFSPDGVGIVYTQPAGPTFEVVIAGQEDDPIDGSTPMGGPAGPVTWSPDGSAIAYLRSTVTGDLMVIHTLATGAESTVAVTWTGPIDWAPVPTAAPGEFTDVAADNVFYADIAWLAGEGITKGCNPPTNTMFCPDDFVTRGQMAAFLGRAFGYTDNGGGDLFTDDDGSIFESDIDKLATAGVTKGCNPPTNDRFCPDDFVTRGQMAAFLHRAFGD